MVGFFMVMITGRYLHLTASATIRQQNADPAIMQQSPGAAQKNLLLRDLRNYRFMFPMSTHKQQEIVDQLDALAAETQRLEGIYRQKIAALEALKKSLLHQAFSGEMTFAEAKAASHDRYGEAYEELAR